MRKKRDARIQGNVEEIRAKIDRGIAQLDRGEGIPGDPVRARLLAHRAEWLASRGDRQTDLRKKR